MVFEVFAIGAAFVFGLIVRQAGLPPLVGFLAAGFAINALGPAHGMPESTGPILEHLAHLGVLMLLFTVLAAKMLEAKREIGNFHGRTAIGVLIVQDVVALVVMAAFSGKVPGPWALLIFAAPFLRPVLFRLLDLAGHDEVLVLTGMLLSLVLGGVGFEAIGLKGEIGALVMGLLLSTHPRASELSDSLWSLKEMFLVGFFLSIGMSGLPDWNALAFALVLGVLLPLKGVLFFFLLIAFRLRARTAFLSALSLTAYSEFGLIVAAGIPEAQPFLVPLALAVSISFLVAAPLNRFAHPLFERFEARLQPLQRVTRHPDEQPRDLGDADILIFGMGRTGSAAYERMEAEGRRPVGLDADTYKAKAHQEAGRNVIFADAEDSNFWSGVRLHGIEAAILAMDDLEAKVIAARTLREKGFEGPIVAHALYEEHVEKITEAGADETYLTMREAGRSLAAHALRATAPAEGGA